MTFWRDWVGLPWEWGADPRGKQAACCFKTAQATREELGMPWPADRMERWYAEARRGCWEGLRQDWWEMTTPIERPEAGALVRFDNPDDAFGVGVLADANTLLTVRHYGRLMVGPLSALGKLKLYRLQ